MSARSAMIRGSPPSRGPGGAARRSPPAGWCRTGRPAAGPPREGAPAGLAELAERARGLKDSELPPEITPLPPLFRDLDELKAFRERHARARLPRAG
ncbi:MAG: hypothetical protein LBG06_08840, partial [Deltaproteobacteria bacterium]|nr:hypothetical protein [Deltaproteobacteria bacterium]